MPDYITSTNPPHAASQTFVYDTGSGYYRSLLNSDFYGGTQNIKIQTSNGQNVTTINPLPVKMAATSATAFGEVLVSQVRPEIQQFLSSINDAREWELFSGQNDGYFRSVTGMGQISIGTTNLAYASIRTKNFIRYNPGQGAIVRFTAAFSSGVANSLQLVGAYHAEDGFMVGYNGTDFGLCHRYGRKLEIQKLTLSGASTAAGNVTITLNGTPHAVRLDAVGNIWDDARNIATGKKPFFENGPLGLQYDYETFQLSGDVYFTRQTHGGTTGAYSFNAGSTNASGSFSQIQSGANGTQEWYLQSGWTYDSLTGDGPSAMTLNPQKLNIYEIKYGWLGALPVQFNVGMQGRQEMIPIHTISWTNIKNIPSVEDPRFPIAYSVASAGSTTAMSIEGASVFGALEGPSLTKHNEFSYVAEATANTTETPILSIINSRINLSNNIFNRRRFYIDFMFVTNESATKAATVRVYQGKKDNLAGFNFRVPSNLDTIAISDLSATAIISNSNLNLIKSLGIAPTSAEEIKINRDFLPQDVLIVTTSTSSSTAPLIISINGYEDN